MQLIDGQPVFSATDLVGYLACEHLTALEAAALAGLVERPNRPDPELDVIRRRGEQHELRYLGELRALGKSVVTIERHDDEERGARLHRQADETISAMRRGADVIYQATFFDGRWLGYADFLLRVEDAAHPSAWGAYHYEVADTKLARHVKAGAVLQICSYVDQLERLQGVLPASMKVVLGGSAHEVAELRTDDYMAYYRAAKRRFEETVLGSAAKPAPTPEYPPANTYPEPVEHCGVCRWAPDCEARRRADDHLSLVAGISARQRKELGKRDIKTLTALGTTPIPFDPPLKDGEASMERVREQARIQLAGHGLATPLHELLPVEPERGLAILPAPDAGDLFFDIEGDPFALDDGVDYLFGFLDTADDFTAFWSVDARGEVSLEGEKRAFETFIDFVMTRLARYPKMHVYHYAPYEPTALKRLMGRHATREAEVDTLLRGGVLVDLFRTVRQGVRASVESYSIKKLEPIYGFHREIDLRDAGSSIVAFEEWLQLGEGERPSSDILQRIEAYNRDDVVSNARLRAWLEGLRIEVERDTGMPVPRPAERVAEAPEELTEADAQVQRVAGRLTHDVPVDPAERSDEQQARWLLAQLLSWHRREDKATWWDFYRRIGLTSEELVDEDAGLGQLELVSVSEPYRPTPRSGERRAATYRFPPQEHRHLNERSDLFDPAQAQALPAAPPWDWRINAELGEVDDAAATVTLIWKGTTPIHHPRSIVALNRIDDKVLRAALLRIGEWVAEHGVDADGRFRAARDLLLRRAPRRGHGAEAPLKPSAETDLDAARRLGGQLDHGTLAIQGPPGSGKTHTGVRMAVELLRAGKTVGISATSHKVIGNFLEMLLKAGRDAGVAVRAVQRADKNQGLDHDVELADGGRIRDGLADGTFNVAAGTPWLWAAEKSADIVDVLFVDEAGQISLANVLAMAGSTASIVLLGDPQQLDQPLQGTHPPGADRSALAHLLGPHDTMPDTLGLFLERTWRLHPRITEFTSEAFYEGRLLSRDGLEVQELRGPAPLGGVGLRLSPSVHSGDANESDEEARQVATLVRSLVESGSTWVNQQGEECPLTWSDVLVVAPYNAQVGAIRQLLPDEARVGTVDKFQGQEAPISIYSMTTSSPEDAPRGMDFLYSRNRLNVATSRARCVAVVVASPELLRVRARTPEQMRLANALCQFVELAT